MVIQLDSREMEELGEDDDDDENQSKFYNIFVENPFNSKMMEVFQGSNIEKILQNLFAHIKTQIENPALEESGFSIDSIMHLDIDFHWVQLTRGSSYIDLPK